MHVLHAATFCLIVAGAIPGCFDAPSDGGEKLSGPGVKTTIRMHDEFDCSPALFAANGCPIVRLPVAETQCVGAAEAYISCAMTVHWQGSGGGNVTATAEEEGAAAGGAGGSRRECVAPPGDRCEVGQDLTVTRDFERRGQEHRFSLHFETRAEGEAPAGGESASGVFRLVMDVELRS